MRVLYMEYTTSISDLPSSSMSSQPKFPIDPQETKTKRDSHANLTYQPLTDVFPHPLGFAPNKGEIDFTKLDEQPEHHRLEARDIPRDQSQFALDEHMQPSYIPRPRYTDDYIAQYRPQRPPENRLDELLSSIQLPLFLAIVFYLFQMPFMNNIIKRYFAFMGVSGSDGNLTSAGQFVHAFLFGSTYFVSRMITDYATDNVVANSY